MATDIMTYEDIPLKVTAKKKNVVQNLEKNALHRIPTSHILWFLIKRHKYGLVVDALVFENVYLVLHFFTVI